MADQIRLEVRGAVATITLNNPDQHNALTKVGIGQFMEHLDHIEHTPKVRAVVIAASGGRTFCSGAALHEINAGTISSDTFQLLADRLAALPLPKVVALDGNVYGGGVEIGLCCDFRVGIPDLKLTVPAARFGLCYPLNGIQRFVSNLGVGAAKRILVAAETICAPELITMGYLHRLVERDQVLDHANAWAQEISQLAPLAVTAMLRICDQAADGVLNRAEALTWVGECNTSNDLKTGLQAAVDKQTPVFSGS